MNATTTTKASSEPHRRVKVPWSALVCLLMGLALMVHGVVLIFTVYMAVVGIFFLGLGLLLCVGAMESLAPDVHGDEPEHH